MLAGSLGNHDVESEANLDHIPEFHDLLAPVFDIFGFARHEHHLQFLANLAKFRHHLSACHFSGFSSRYGGHEHLWDVLHRCILERCRCRLGHGGKCGKRGE